MSDSNNAIPHTTEREKAEQVLKDMQAGNGGELVRQNDILRLRHPILPSRES